MLINEEPQLNSTVLEGIRPKLLRQVEQVIDLCDSQDNATGGEVTVESTPQKTNTYKSFNMKTPFQIGESKGR